MAPESDLSPQPCAYCAEVRSIHPASVTQVGEPLCVPCFNTCVTADPTNDEQYANSPDDLYAGLYTSEDQS